MRLASVTVQGFKSFRERVRLEFPQGISAIVGPNGSGKSNIIDALRWASGGGRASEFRAGDKTELIFHGATGKRKVGFAEVILTLEDDASRPLTVSRSIFQDGSSKLKLAGKAARFLDIDEALAGSGLGRGGLAVIGQGQVSHVLMANPETLLSYVAEANGLTRLSHRRDQTLARLAQSQDHFERLHDLLLELSQQLETLSLEAKQAEQERTLTRTTLQLRYSLSYHRYHQLQQEVTTFQQKLSAINDALARYHADVQAAKTQWDQVRQQSKDAEQVYRDTLSTTEAKKGDVRVAEEQLARAKEQARALERELADVKKTTVTLKAVSMPVAPQGNHADFAQKLKAVTTLQTEQQAKLSAEETQQQTLEKELTAAYKAQQHYITARAHLESRQQQLSEQHTHLQQRLQELAQQPLPYTGEDLETQLNTCNAHIATLETQHTALQAELRQAEQAHANSAAEHLALTHQHQRAVQAFEARQGYAQGPRHALRSGIGGVIGSVADLIEVPESYQAALASALGRRVEHVVVDTSDTAQKVLAYVKRYGGWVTLLPLDLMQRRTATLPHALTAEPGFIGMALDLIGFKAEHHTVIAQLLGNTTIVQDLHDATAIAKAYRQRPRLVTLAGDLLESYGAISGGKRSVNTALLTLRDDVRHATEQTQAAKQATETAKQHKLALTQKQRAAEQALQEALQKRQHIQQKVQDLNEHNIATTSLQTDLQTQMSTVQHNLTQLTPLAPPPLHSSPEALEAKLQTLRATQATTRQHLTETRSQVATLKQAYALFEEQEHSYEQALARYQDAHTQLHDLTIRQQHLTQTITQAQTHTQQAQQRLTQAQEALPHTLPACETAYHEAMARSSAAEAQLAKLSEQQSAHAGEADDLKLTLARRESALEGAHEALRAFPEGLGALELTLPQLRKRLQESEAALTALGPVNHRAAQEFSTQKARYDALKHDTDEAQAAAEELRGMIKDIDLEVTGRLNNALSTLSQRFQEHIEQLFGSGACGAIEVLRQDGRPDGPPMGLRIHLQPSNKQTTSLNLLSVGERTMGALGFLFALMAKETSEPIQQGLPLAVLDEVDAPLDEANIRRFCHFVTQLALSGTQFILITHQKATMEVADALWGVTTEQGVSRVFSIKKDTEVAA